MSNPVSNFQLEELSYSWSNRILALSVAGILFLTLYPFRFSFHAALPGNSSPFLLASGVKSSGAFNAFLNVMLFVPFGWGLSQKLRAKGKSRGATFLVAVAASALFSYSIEFIQLYIPTRDSGWEDVFTNTTGGMLGYFASEMVGRPVLSFVSRFEYRLEQHLTPGRAFWVIPIYFAIWFAVSVPLQEQSRLSNWVSNPQLLVGNDASGHSDRAWKGRVSLLQFWDEPLPAGLARKITAGEKSADGVSTLLARYEFSTVSPYQDQNKFLPALSWTPSTPDMSFPGDVSLTGSSWLTSVSPVPSLVQTLQKVNQFSMQIVCAPAEIEGVDGRVVSLSQADGQVDLILRQKESNLVFWFRTPLAMRRGQLALSVPDVFIPHEVRNILVSYDGSNLSFYMNGERDARVYELTPGTPLAQLIRYIKTSELEGYTFIYYALVFVPAGVLLGVVARRLTSWNVVTAMFLGIAVLLPPICLELLLLSVSGRAFALPNVLLSALLAMGGILWINVDRKSRRIESLAG